MGNWTPTSSLARLAEKASSRYSRRPTYTRCKYIRGTAIMGDNRHPFPASKPTCAPYTHMQTHIYMCIQSTHICIPKENRKNN